MASRHLIDRLMRAVEKLGDEEVVRVVEFAESLRGSNPENGAKPYRPLGFYRGQIKVDQSFYDPLPDEIIRQFEGEEE